MRYLDRLVGLAAIAAASSIALPAEAAQGRKPWAKVGEWEVAAERAGDCSAVRAYPGGTRLSVSSSGGRHSSVSALNRAWSLQTAGRYRLTLVRDGTRQSLAGESDTFLHGLGAMAGSDGLLTLLAGGGILEIAGPDGRVIERLELAGLAPAIARLGPCIAEAATAANFPPVAAPPPPPRPPRSAGPRPARAQANIAGLFSSDDYPAAAILAGEQGAVAFRLDVGKDGRVGACTVTESSGSAALDSTTCEVIRMRARFQPALDDEGKPVEDSFSGRIVWRLPEPEPPPPPSP